MSENRRRPRVETLGLKPSCDASLGLAQIAVARLVHYPPALGSLPLLYGCSEVTLGACRGGRG